MRLTSGSWRICPANTMPSTTPTSAQVIFSFVTGELRSGLVALDRADRASDGEEVDDLVQGRGHRPGAGQLDRVAHGGVEHLVEEGGAWLGVEVLVEPQVVDALVEAGGAGRGDRAQAGVHRRVAEVVRLRHQVLPQQLAEL